jgi:hypothetical protein
MIEGAALLRLIFAGRDDETFRCNSTSVSPAIPFGCNTARGMGEDIKDLGIHFSRRQLIVQFS